jgi:hypothetical protein
MISYCIAAFRPWFARRLIADLIRKTTAPYEILVWVNTADPEFEGFLENLRAAGRPVRVIGRSPQNIGMTAFRKLFAQAQYDLIVQMDDDVIFVTPRIAEICAEIFARFPTVKQLVADCWQDEYTSGARPAWSAYSAFDETFGLYNGPIDGWFSVYHRSILPLINRSFPGRSLRVRGKTKFPWFELEYRDSRKYFFLASSVPKRLAKRRQFGLLCTRFKVFHVVGAHYMTYFNAADFELQKYRALGRDDLVQHFEKWRGRTAPLEILEERVKQIELALSQAPAPCPTSSAAPCKGRC